MTSKAAEILFYARFLRYFDSETLSLQIYYNSFILLHNAKLKTNKSFCVWLHKHIHMHVLKTIHVVFSTPIKDELNFMLLFKNTCEVTMQGMLYYTNYQYMYLTNTCACAESPHYLAWIVGCFWFVIVVNLYYTASITIYKVLLAL